MRKGLRGIALFVLTCQSFGENWLKLTSVSLQVEDLKSVCLATRARVYKTWGHVRLS